MLRDLFSLFPAYAGVIRFLQFPERIVLPFPRIRGGDPESGAIYAEQPKLFPAYAGVILSAGKILRALITFPRIRGGDPIHHKKGIWQRNFSPHTRG